MRYDNIKIGELYKEKLNYPNDFRYCFPIEIDSETTTNACINSSKYFVPSVYYEYKKSLSDSDCLEFDKNRLYKNREYITQLVLEKISSLNIEISDWASKVLATYSQIKTQIEESGYAKEQEILLNSGEKIYLSLCSYGKIESLDDVDFFLTGCGFVSSESLYTIACNIVNEDKTREFMKEDKERLFSFYQDEDIEYLMQSPYDLLSEKDKDTLSFFSDWHKDVYGYRPRELANECQYRLAQERIQNAEGEYEHE